MGRFEVTFTWPLPPPHALIANATATAHTVAKNGPFLIRLFIRPLLLFGAKFSAARPCGTVCVHLGAPRGLPRTRSDSLCVSTAPHWLYE